MTNLSVERKKERDSSIELFRIIATFAVLLVHFTGWFVGGITNPHDSSLDLSFRMGQMIIESLSIVCVNCFLIISGWYGMKLRFSSIWKLFTIIFFIYVPFQIIESIYTGHFSIRAFIDNALVFTRESYFVQCYAMLLFLSPMLNSFIERYGKGILNYVLTFWGIEIIMEAIWDNKSLGFENGYSFIHFILIYLLARTAYLYKEYLLHIKRTYWIIGYFGCATIICFLHVFRYNHTWDYSNPIVVIESFCLFFSFLYKSFYNKWINWIAGSTFAVYVMHTCDPLFSILWKADNYLLDTYPYYVYLPCYLGLIILTFFFCILYDKIRIKLTNRFTNIIYTRINKKISHISLYE